MGAADRDWYRTQTAQPRRLAPWSIVILALAGVGLFAAWTHIDRSRRSAPPDPEHVVHHDVSIAYGPGLTVPLKRAPLYASNDPWKPYLASEASCPDAENLDAPLSEQAHTMICLINHARIVRRLTMLPVSAQLSQAATLKGEAIARCKVFAHAPCGGDAHDVAVQAGFEGSWGENIYIADGRYGAPRPALDGWLNSLGHRENLFRPEWRVQSVYVVKLTDFPGFEGPTLWVSQFGT